jgi:hypothetical protein
MSDDATADQETITVTDDGLELPVVEVLTGRGFITGKSGSGKSNTASVVAEELLAHDFPLLIVDTDGEYYGLKEEFEVLHVGGDETCDVQVGAGHAEQLAELALVENVPIVLDVSGYPDPDDVADVVQSVVSALFHREKSIRKPFLVFVEEMHEFVPESGGLDDVGETLVRVAKRGRKRGLGLCGMSQRPAAVDKDFITQCDWLVWHRLTWENDTKVAARILGGDADETVQELGDGEAILLTDWDESTRRVQFRHKRTFDAGATPGLEDFDRPELETVSSEVLSRLESAEGGTAEPDADVEALQKRLEEKDERIAALEAEVEQLREGQTDGEGNRREANSDSSGTDAEANPNGEETPDAKPNPEAETDQDPIADAAALLWESGYLVVHLLATLGRRLARAGRWTARTTVRGSRGAVEWLEVDDEPVPEETVALLVLLGVVAVSLVAAAFLF